MSAPPKVFISATSGDLRSVRQIVKEALLTINCHPVEQTNFEPDWRTVSDMLKAKIEGCQALIHIVGMRYGSEPDAASLPPGTPRRSYTQMEYAIGCQLHEQRGDDGFRVYTFICPEDFPYDTGADPEPEDKAQLQREHRARLIDSPRLYEKPSTADDIHVRILALQEQVLALLQQQAEVKHEVRRSNRLLVLVLGLLLALGAGGYVASRLLHKDIVESQKIDTAKIKTHLRESSEHRLEQDIAAADKEMKATDRQRLRDAAQAAHQSRLARIDDLASSFALLEGKADASTELKEMTRILSEEGVDTALAYIEGQRSGILARATAGKAAQQEQMRTQLQPLLQEAGLLKTKGQTAAALASYQQLLQLDPLWPEALLALARTYDDQRLDFWNWGPRKDLKTTLAEAEAAIAYGEKLTALGDGQSTGSNLVLANALSWCSDLLKQRGQAGDLKLALAHITRSLTLAESYLQANPLSIDAARDVSISLERMADFLLSRGQSGDGESALKHYQRNLEVCEKLLAANPDSAQATRDLTLSLNKLGNFLTQRGQPGDAEAAFKHLTRSLELCEKLLAAAPDSAQATRDLTLSLNKLGDFLDLRGKPGDAKAALQHYTRSLELREKLLAANPDSALAALYVSSCLDRLGDLLFTRGQPGDADAALKSYNRSLEQREQILAANPDFAQAQRDVSVSLNRIGDFLVQRGQPADAEVALKGYIRSLELNEKLLAASPDSAQVTRELTLTLERLGILLQRGKPSDVETALKHFFRSLELREKLLAATPDSALATRDASWARLRLGNLLAKRGHPGDVDAALQHYTICLELREKLLAANPGSASAARDLSWAWQMVAELLVKRGNPGDLELAHEYYTRCLNQREKLLATNPDSAQAVRDVWHICKRLADLAEKTGQGDAKAWWKRAYDILNGMAQKGMFLSETDKKDLEMMRKKAAPSGND